jgi:hypothetical protein
MFEIQSAVQIGQAPTSWNDRLTDVPVAAVDFVDPVRALQPERVTELADGLKATGVLQHPIVVTLVEGGRFRGVSGRHRLEAARLAGWHHIPAFVVDLSPAACRLLAVIENLHRADLTVMERAEHMAAYADHLQVVQVGPPSGGQQPEDRGIRKLARHLDLDRAAVRRSLRVASLSPDAKEAACVFGLDNNQNALVEASYEKTPEAQVNALRGMARRLAHDRDVPHVEVFEVIDYVRSIAHRLRPHSYYVYRAMILQELRDLYAGGQLTDADAKMLVERMSAEAARMGSKVKRANTSAGRQRSVRPETIGALVSVLSAKRHPTSDNLADMLEYGPWIGLRPIEFFNCRLDGRTLWIRSAKVSPANDRGLAQWRRIELADAFDAHGLEAIRRLLSRLRREIEAVGGNRNRLVRRYAAALRRARMSVASASRLVLQTTRRQFRANLARAGYTRRPIP